MYELQIVDTNLVPLEDRSMIDVEINRLLAEHKSNKGEISRLTMDCVVALTTSDARSRALSRQGLFGRLWGNITGKNNRLQNAINTDNTAAMYASQQCLIKIAEQNLMTVELIVAVNNKLNTGIKTLAHRLVNLDDEINQIYRFLNQTRSNILQFEFRMESLERNVNLLNWKVSIEYQMFDGIEYSALSQTGKIVCLTKDFWEITKGKWSASDMLLLKSALSEVGLLPQCNLTYWEFLMGLIREPKFLKHFMHDVKSENVDAMYTTILAAVHKYQLLLSAEKACAFDILTAYVADNAAVDLKGKVSVYDLCLEILSNFLQVNPPEEQASSLQTNLQEEQAVLKSSYMELLKQTESTFVRFNRLNNDAYQTLYKFALVFSKLKHCQLESVQEHQLPDSFFSAINDSNLSIQQIGNSLNQLNALNTNCKALCNVLHELDIALQRQLPFLNNIIDFFSSNYLSFDDNSKTYLSEIAMIAKNINTISHSPIGEIPSEQIKEMKSLADKYSNYSYGISLWPF